MNGCNKCPAHDKCTVTYRGSGCAALRSTYGLDDDPEVMTNADHLRDELSDDINLAIKCVEYEGRYREAKRFDGDRHWYGPKGEEYSLKYEAIQAWLDWLRQPGRGPLMTCEDCTHFQFCIDEAYRLGQVFDPAYDGKHRCDLFETKEEAPHD